VQYISLAIKGVVKPQS